MKRKEKKEKNTNFYRKKNKGKTTHLLVRNISIS